MERPRSQSKGLHGATVIILSEPRRYMVGKLAPNSAHLTRGTWSNMSPGGDSFVPYLHKKGINLRSPPPPPHSFNAAWEQEFIMQA